MSYLPGDVLASLSSLSSRLDSLQAPLSHLAALPQDCSPALEAAKTELALAYAQYVLLYVCRRVEGEDGGEVKEGVGRVRECAEGIQEAMKKSRSIGTVPSNLQTALPHQPQLSNSAQLAHPS